MSDALLLVTLVTLPAIAGSAVVVYWIISRKISDWDAGLSERLSQLDNQLYDKVGTANESLGKTLQQSLQEGRMEQHSVLQHSVQTLEGKFNDLKDRVDSKLQQTVDANRQDLATVSERLTRLHEATGQMVLLSKGVNELHTMLKTPKLRGVFGEWTLEKMLADVLGPPGTVFRTQYTLQSGTVADAVIFTRPDSGQMVCIDAKFPTTQAHQLLQEQLTDDQRKLCRRQFRRDVLVQAKSIGEKYISPPQTLGYAFLYVPAESIFQLILEEPELHADLLKLNVIPTSPNSFFAYLQSLVFALSGMRIQQHAVEVQKQIALVGRDFEKLARGHHQLGDYLHKATSKYEQTVAAMNRFHRRISKIQQVDEMQDQAETNPDHDSDQGPADSQVSTSSVR